MTWPTATRSSRRSRRCSPRPTANGCTEAEMMSALDKASAMMDAYDITDEEVQIAKDEAAMLHADPPDLKDPHKIKWRLCYGVAEFCGVQIFRSRHRNRPQVHRYAERRPICDVATR